MHLRTKAIRCHFYISLKRGEEYGVVSRTHQCIKSVCTKDHLIGREIISINGLTDESNGWQQRSKSLDFFSHKLQLFETVWSHWDKNCFSEESFLLPNMREYSHDMNFDWIRPLLFGSNPNSFRKIIEQKNNYENLWTKVKASQSNETFFLFVLIFLYSSLFL